MRGSRSSEAPRQSTSVVHAPLVQGVPNAYVVCGILRPSYFPLPSLASFDPVEPVTVEHKVYDCALLSGAFNLERCSYQSIDRGAGALIHVTYSHIRYIEARTACFHITQKNIVSLRFIQRIAFIIKGIMRLSQLISSLILPSLEHPLI